MYWVSTEQPYGGECNAWESANSATGFVTALQFTKNEYSQRHCGSEKQPDNSKRIKVQHGYPTQKNPDIKSLPIILVFSYILSRADSHICDPDTDL